MLYIICQVYKYDIYVLVETIFRNILKSSGNKSVLVTFYKTLFSNTSANDFILRDIF